MPDPALTPEQYVEQAGIPCPGCGDTRFVDYQPDGENFSANSALVRMCCTECKSTWEDEFMLTGYVELKQPEEGVDA